MLTIANGAEIRVEDLTRSDLKSGRLEIVKSVFAPNNVLYSIGLEHHETDPQNGITYRYKGNFLYYEIYREGNGTSTLFFSMPQADRAWTLAARIGFVMWIPYVLGGILLWSFTSNGTRNTPKKRRISGRSAKTNQEKCFSLAAILRGIFLRKIPLARWNVRAIIKSINKSFVYKCSI